MVSRILLPVLLLGTLVLTFPHNTATAEDPNQLDPPTVKAVLRTTTPAQEAFVDRVLSLVTQGRLPRSTVVSTYLWARSKPADRRFYYFQHAIRLRAAKHGVNL